MRRRQMMLLVLLLGATPRAALADPPPSKCISGKFTGPVTQDTLWCDVVTLTGNVRVARNATLTINPGTRVRVTPFRDYRQPGKRLRIRVEGTLVALGRPGALIRFSSAHPEPRNGDWTGIHLAAARGAKLAHVSIEFAEQGLTVTDTDVTLKAVVLRFNNWEGLRARGESKVRLVGSRVYANGYNCVDAREGVVLLVKDSYVANCGMLGIHIGAATARIEQSLIDGHNEGLFLEQEADVTLEANRFSGQLSAGISCGHGRKSLRMGNNVFDGLPAKSHIICPGVKRLKLATDKRSSAGLRTQVTEGPGAYIDYIPGHRPRDLFPYTYPPRDATRVVTHQLGAGLGQTWSVAWDGKALWAANRAHELLRLDPASGKVLARVQVPHVSILGMTYHDRKLWICDGARRSVVALDPATGKELKRFKAPDTKGGCRGITHDGRHLYVLGWATPRLYQLSDAGKVLSSVPAPTRDLGGGVQLPVSGGLAWDGRAFWAPADGLVRFDRQGRALGWIHSTAARVKGLAWDGAGLWTAARTHEQWTNTPRLFRVKVKKVKSSRHPAARR